MCLMYVVQERFKLDYFAEFTIAVTKFVVILEVVEILLKDICEVVNACLEQPIVGKGKDRPGAFDFEFPTHLIIGILD